MLNAALYKLGPIPPNKINHLPQRDANDTILNIIAEKDVRIRRITDLHSMSPGLF